MSRLLSVISVVFASLLIGICRPDEIGQTRPGPKWRVAVVGGGIGGSTASLFLREEFGNDVEITLFEKDKIGGRLATMQVGGRFYEAGGAVIHPMNKLMANLTEYLGLSRSKEPPVDFTFGLYDGNEIVFQTHRYRFFTSFINSLRLLWRYGYDLLKMDPWVDGVIKWYAKIYPALLRSKTSFSSVYDMFHTQSSLFDDLIGSSIGDYLNKLGFGVAFRKELARIAMRTNYGQDLDIHGFVGAISLAGAQGGLWSVEGGNYRVAEKAFEKSGARWVKSRVAKILESSGVDRRKSFRVVTDSTDDEFDAVILAVPCTVDGCGGIQFNVEGIEKKLRKFPKSYHRTVANFVKGKLDTKRFFGADSDYFPDCLYSVAEEQLLFMSVCRQVPADYGNKPNEPTLASEFDVYKLFTLTPLTKHHVDRMFKTHSEFHVADWMAYPNYDEIATDVEASLPSFILDFDGGLVSINAIEASASAMEQSVIAAKNAALLVAKFLMK